MTISNRPRIAVVAAAVATALVSASVFTLAASGKSRHGGPRGQLFSSSLAGSIPSDPAIHTKTPGGVPWDLEKGQTSLSRNGQFRLRVKGLVITGTGSAAPITSITASLFCAPDSDATPKFTVGPVPLSADGDARIKATVTVPSRCLAPVVLVHPNGAAARYIAASGFQL